MNKISKFLDDTLIDLGRQFKWTYLPPLMIYMAAGISGLTGIVGIFFVKDYLNLSAAFLAGLGFWAGIPWALKMPLGHLVDLIWNKKNYMVFVGAGLIALSLLIMYGLIVHTELMSSILKIETWFVISILLAPIGYVVQDVVADAMTVEAVPLVDDNGQKFSKDEINTRINEVANLLRIDHLLSSKVSGLAGGDRQRVALGRAIVRRPKAFLMDEPLGTLDAEFRELMCLELRKLHNNIDATTVYVTHDQLEAMSMGDRIAVMHKGRILQHGKPKDIYTKPKTKFVGSFIGSPAMNFIPVNHTIQKNQNSVKIDNEEYAVPKSFQNTSSQNNVLGVRPEKMFLSDNKGIPGEVYGSEYLGTRKILTIQSRFGTYKIRVSNDVNLKIGANVKISFDSDSAIIFDGQTDEALHSEFIN